MLALTSMWSEIQFGVNRSFPTTKRSMDLFNKLQFHSSFHCSCAPAMSQVVYNLNRHQRCAGPMKTSIRTYCVHTDHQVTALCVMQCVVYLIFTSLKVRSMKWCTYDYQVVECGNVNVRLCLVPKKFLKKCYNSYHIESCDTCIEH